MGKCLALNHLNLIGKKWTIVIMQQVDFYGKEGFNSLFRRVKIITPKIVTRKLKELEQQGLVHKETVLNGKSVRTKYFLTETGKEILRHANSLMALSAKLSCIDAKCGKIECVNCKYY